MPPDFETVQALRNDVALQIARYTQRLGISQLAAAKQLDVPQPTLSKIVNGHTSDLSLELLLRIAVRAGLRITLQTGLIPQEAGAFVSAGRPPSTRAFRSKIAAGTHAALKESQRVLTPAQRLEAFLEHNQLASELRESGRAAQALHLPPASFRQ
ncbi:MAG: XRE family transcriptional regulator [Gammaproteobacteria bacterium]